MGKKKKARKPNSGNDQPTRPDVGDGTPTPETVAHDDSSGNVASDYTTKVNQELEKEQCNTDVDSGSTVLQGVTVTQNIHARNVQVGNENVLINTLDTEDLQGACGGINDSLTNPRLNQNTLRTRTISGESEGRNSPSDKMSYAQACTTQNFQADNINILIGPQFSDKSHVHSKSFQRFLDSVKNFGEESKYILVIGKTEQITFLDTLARVPWITVFDFDPDSKRSGLLSNVQENIENDRALHINCWSDRLNIVDGSTSWVLMKGSSERPDTITEDDFKKWKRQIKDSLKTHIERLRNFQTGYAELTIVVVWPSDPAVAQHINFLSKEIEEETECSIVLVDDGKGTSEISKSYLINLQTEADRIDTVEMSLSDMCTAISSCLLSTKTADKSDFQLPKSDTTEKVLLTCQQAQLLKEELEVLYLNNKTDIDYDLARLQKETDAFFKGGTLPWAWWYHTGPGEVDVERDLMKSMEQYIMQRHLSVYRPGCITLYHAPGSGGTTLAQRILWDLKDKTPCAQVKYHRTGSSISDIADKVQLLHDKTHLPILLLMDGVDEQRVNFLQRSLREYCCLVILYVKRYPSSIENKKSDLNKGIFWLNSFVSPKEAKHLGLKYNKQCKSDTKKDYVYRLINEVETRQEKHSIFEFGLAMHSYEYVGIESYVKGFLRLEENTDGELEPWQQALWILSLVYYYGQSSIPCYFLSKLMGNSSPQLYQLQDFPEEMRDLIVRDTTERKSNVIRISHYYVAKEILDHILPWPRIPKKQLSPSICSESKAKLEEFAIHFIKASGVINKDTYSTTICVTMRQTFISRDNKAVGENETQVNKMKKRKVSPIMEDVGSRAPFTERLNVMKQLAESFPKESQFYAHLGRLYSICRPEDEDTAEKYFETALDICNHEIEGINPNELHHNMKLTLMHVYHMYGNMYLSIVSKYTGKHLGDRPQIRTNQSEFEDTASRLLPKVKHACYLFAECRKVTPPGCDESYGFISEISIRLMFCDFVRSNAGVQSTQYFEHNNSEIATFFQECFVQLDELFIECFIITEPDKMDDNMINCQEWFAALFGTSSPCYILQRSDDNIQTRRMKIASIKMKYSDSKRYGVLEAITIEDDIALVVQSYETIFREADPEKQNFSERAMNIDYGEWLCAIRHPLLRCEYSIEKVLQHVQKWYDCVKSQNARFYLFITKSLFGFGFDGRCGNYQMLHEAQFLKDELHKHAKFISKPKYPREWLGPQTSTIRRLAPGRRFYGQVEGRVIQYQCTSAYANPLEIVTGTICPPNDKPAWGFIDLDLGPQNRIAVKVFFVPVRADMRGKSFVGKKVEFVIGFTMAHGYEAFNVTKIEEIRCKKCEKLVEIRSCEKGIVCPRCSIYTTRQLTNKPQQSQ